MQSMTNNIVTVFVASSFEVHDARVALGNCIRMLNDKYEDVGIRVKLNCWEDYKPEYTGERKQDEYNRDLVLTSQILIALFKNRCGGYTQEEVKLGISCLGKQNVHCFYEINDNVKIPSSDVVNFFCENSIEAKPYDTVKDICTKVTAIVEEYINTNCTKTALLVKNSNVSNVYATVPADLQSCVPELGNIVRHLDMILEENFQSRFKLAKLRSLNDMPNCDYYILLYEREFSSKDMIELDIANNGRQLGYINALAIYEKPEADWAGNDLRKKLDEWGHFPVRLDNWDVLRFKTLIYLVSHIMNIGFNSLGANNLIELKGNRIMCSNHYIGDFNVLRTLKDGLFADEIKKWNDVHNRLCLLEEDSKGKIFNNPTNEYLQLSQIKKELEQRLKNYFALTVDFLLKETECVIKENQHLRELYDAGKYRKVIEEVDTKNVAEAAAKDISIIEDRIVSLQMRLEQIELKIKSLMSTIMSGEAAQENIVALYDSFDDKLSVQECAYLHCLVKEEDIIATLYQYISSVDSWNCFTPQKKDVLYTKLVHYADNGRVSNLEIEGIRGNYANFLSRDFKFEEACAQYETAINNILALNDESRNTRKSVCVMYMNYVSCFDDFYDSSHVEVLDRWRTLVERYVNDDEDFIIELADVCTKEMMHWPLNSGLENRHISQLNGIVEKLRGRYDVLNEHDQHNLLHSVIVLACYYIDRFEHNPVLCTYKATYFLDVALDFWQSYKKTKFTEALSYSSQINHNRAFLYTRNHNWCAAEPYYNNAYKEREKLSIFFGDKKSKSNLAETAVNLSDCLLHLGKYDEAIEYANKAVEFYSAQLQPEYEHTCMNFYKAKQMLGSIFVRIPYKKEEGLDMLEECWGWASGHQNSTYHRVFKDISFRILKQCGRI